MTVKINGSAITLPKEFLDSVFVGAQEASVVARLSGSDAVTLGGNAYPIYTGGIEAGVVGEGENASISNPNFGVKYLEPVKVSTVITVSKEMASENPGDLLRHVQSDLSASIGRALDALALHGKDAKSGAPVAGKTGVAATLNRVEVVNGDLKAALLGAFDLVDAEADANGLAVDSRSRGRLLNVTGETQYGLPANLVTNEVNVAGVPAVFGRTVGRTAGVDNKIKAILGDWSNLRYGFARDIELETSTEATLVDGDQIISTFQKGLVALKVTATVGAVVINDKAFAVIEDVTA